MPSALPVGDPAPEDGSLPAASLARHTLACHIEAPSAWDSNVTLMVLVETLLAAVQDLTWTVTEARMKRLEDLYARTRLFRRHR